MKRYSGRMLAAAVLLVLAALPLVVSLSASPAEPRVPRTRGEFMRQKLEFAKNVLEGLSLEQYPEIEKNAKALKRLSGAAE